MDPFDWSLSLIIKEAATKSKLMNILTSGEPPSLLFIAGHGLQFDKGDPSQEAAAGAILCADWPGFGDMRKEMFLLASDVDSIWISAELSYLPLCRTVTSRFDDFHMPFQSESRWENANHDMMSRLPMQWLCAPERGALAFIGHVDRNYSFPITATKTGDAEPQPAPGLFSQMLRQLMNGYTVGLAMDNFRRRFALNATLLLSQLTTQKPGDESRELVEEQLATLDIRNYVIVGDPAVSTPARRAELQ